MKNLNHEWQTTIARPVFFPLSLSPMDTAANALRYGDEERWDRWRQAEVEQSE